MIWVRLGRVSFWFRFRVWVPLWRLSFQRSVKGSCKGFRFRVWVFLESFALSIP